MKNDEMRVMGIEPRVSSKTQKPYYMLHVEHSFNDYQLQHNAAGLVCESLYLTNIPVCKIGDIVKPVYGVGYQNRAVVTDIVVVESTK